MKIIEMNDCDWWIGESLEACVADYQNNIDGGPEYFKDARELTDEELDKLTFTVTDAAGDKIGKRSFREQLAIEIAEGGTFPRIFASTEV